MKRINGLWDEILDSENKLITEAIFRASSGKTKREDVKIVINDYENKAKEIRNILINGWIPKPYKNKQISDKGKVRTLQIAKFFPDRIIHHLIDIQLQKVFLPTFISDTYQCIQGRGTHKAIAKAEGYVQHHISEYVLKADISKFYPSVDNDILKSKIQRKIKDSKFLELVYTLIDTTTGLPLGNCTSQILGNIFLNDLDHLLKSKTKAYIRYADDIVIFGSKKDVQMFYKCLEQYFNKNKLKLNPSTQYFPLDKRYLEFLGFRFFRTHTRPKRKTLIKYVKNKLSREEKASIYGWLKNSNSLIYILKIFDQSIYSKEYKYIQRYILTKIGESNENNRSSIK